MNELVIVRNNEVLTDSLIIAEGTANEHRAVKQLIRTYESQFLELNTFNISNVESQGLQILNRESTGGRPEQYYELNEPQATFLITLLKNTPVVVSFKLELVKQFYQMRMLIQGNALVQPNIEAYIAAAVSRELDKRLNRNLPIKEKQHPIVASYISAINNALKSGEYYLKKKYALKRNTPSGIMLGMYDEFCYYLVAVTAFEIYKKADPKHCKIQALYALMRNADMIRTYGNDSTNCTMIDGKKRATLTLYRSAVELHQQ